MDLTLMLEQVLAALLPIVITGLGWVIGQAAVAARRKWGVEIDTAQVLQQLAATQDEVGRREIEAKHRAALDSALLTAAETAVRERPDGALDGQGAKAQIREYVRASVPDALAALSPAPDVLDHLVMRTLSRVVQSRRGSRDGS